MCSHSASYPQSIVAFFTVITYNSISFWRTHMKRWEDRIAKIKKTISEIQAQEAHEAHLKGAFVIDVRSLHEFNINHIEGSIHLGRDFLEFKIEEIVPNAENMIIVTCGGGLRSLFAAESLFNLGYTNVHSLLGGVKSWEAHNLPMHTTSN